MISKRIEERLRNWWAHGKQDTPCIAGWVLKPNAELPEPDSLLPQYDYGSRFEVARDGICGKSVVAVASSAAEERLIGCLPSYAQDNQR